MNELKHSMNSVCSSRKVQEMKITPLFKMQKVYALDGKNKVKKKHSGGEKLVTKSH